MVAIDGLCESLMPDVPRSVAVAARRCEELGLPPISVTPLMGRFLMLLTLMSRARRVLEIGTLGGYSTAWLASGMNPHGRVVSIEIDPERAAWAQETFRLGGLSDVVEVRCGAGIDELHRLREARADAFDLVFIDADKANSAVYFEASLALTRPGGVIVVDNVIRGGAVLDDSSSDPNVRGSRSVLQAAGRATGARASVVQTVGAKGHDGFIIAVVEA